MKIETDIATIEKLAKQRERENWDFRCFLKGSDLFIRKAIAMLPDSRV